MSALVLAQPFSLAEAQAFPWGAKNGNDRVKPLWVEDLGSSMRPLRYEEESVRRYVAEYLSVSLEEVYATHPHIPGASDHDRSQQIYESLGVVRDGGVEALREHLGDDEREDADEVLHAFVVKTRMEIDLYDSQMVSRHARGLPITPGSIAAEIYHRRTLALFGALVEEIAELGYSPAPEPGQPEEERADHDRGPPRFPVAELRYRKKPIDTQRYPVNREHFEAVFPDLAFDYYEVTDTGIEASTDQWPPPNCVSHTLGVTERGINTIFEWTLDGKRWMGDARRTQLNGAYAHLDRVYIEKSGYARREPYLANRMLGGHSFTSGGSFDRLWLPVGTVLVYEGRMFKGMSTILSLGVNPTVPTHVAILNEDAMWESRLGPGAALLTHTSAVSIASDVMGWPAYIYLPGDDEK